MSDLENKMNAAVLHFEKELNSLRTSRANPSMLDNILVDAYGSRTPLNQLGNISVQDASTITIQVWDSSLIKSILDSKICKTQQYLFTSSGFRINTDICKGLQNKNSKMHFYHMFENWVKNANMNFCIFDPIFENWSKMKKV